MAEKKRIGVLDPGSNPELTGAQCLALLRAVRRSYPKGSRNRPKIDQLIGSLEAELAAYDLANGLIREIGAFLGELSIAHDFLSMMANWVSKLRKGKKREPRK